MATVFSEYLFNAMKEAGISPAELARRSGIDKGIISRTLNNERKPTPETLLAISKGLSKPPDEIFRAAGILPKKPGLNEELEELMHVASDLPPEQIQELIGIARLKLERRQQKKESRINKAPALGR